MINTPNDPLSSLIIDVDELDRKKLSTLLNGFCAISKDGEIRPITNFPTLNNRSKVLAILLAQKAALALDLSNTDQISPKQIEVISGLPGSSVRTNLMRLRQQRLVENSSSGYSVPNHSVLHILLKANKDIDSNTRKPRQKNLSTRKPKENSAEITKMLEIDQSEIGEQKLNLLLEKGKYLERSLAVLAIARKIGIEHLTSSDITQFLKEKIRANVKRENISVALGRGTRYVDRFHVGKRGAYGYKIMIEGDKLLKETINSMKKD